MAMISPLAKNPKILAAHFRIRHIDVFHMEMLYNMLHEWIKERYWRDLYDDTEGDRHESYYMDRTDLYGGKELWIWWRLWRDVAKMTSNSFFRFHMNIDIHAVGMTETEMMQQGKKIKTNKGELEIKIWAWVEMDYKGEWSSHPILKFFLDVFRLRIFYADLLKHKYNLYREAYDLQGAIKKYLHLKGTLPQLEVEPFFRSHGVETRFTG